MKSSRVYYHASTSPDLEGKILRGKLWVTTNKGYHFTLGWNTKYGFPVTYYLYEIRPLEVRSEIAGAYGDERLLDGTFKVERYVDEIPPLKIDHYLSDDEVRKLLWEGVMVD